MTNGTVNGRKPALCWHCGRRLEVVAPDAPRLQAPTLAERITLLMWQRRRAMTAAEIADALRATRDGTGRVLAHNSGPTGRFVRHADGKWGRRVAR